MFSFTHICARCMAIVVSQVMLSSSPDNELQLCQDTKINKIIHMCRIKKKSSLLIAQIVVNYLDHVSRGTFYCFDYFYH